MHIHSIAEILKVYSVLPFFENSSIKEIECEFESFSFFWHEQPLSVYIEQQA